MRRTWRSTLVGVGVGLLVLVSAPTASAQDAAGAPYVALGDSYTASPLTGTNAGDPIGCFRSTNDYPHLLAAQLDVEVTDASCAGATTASFEAPQVTRAGTNAPQFSALGADTRLVTVGVGGNDIGFAEIVRTCLSALPFGAPCRDRWTTGGTDALRERITDLGPRLAKVLRTVHRRAPHARVALVGYPAVLPGSGPGCYPAVPITPADVAYLRGVLIDLNARIAHAAAAGDAAYVDTYAPSVGHDFCGTPSSKWVEGLVPTAPALPFHPNAAGSAATARAVVSTLTDPVE